jgi:hypothetical protein
MRLKDCITKKRGVISLLTPNHAEIHAEMFNEDAAWGLNDYVVAFTKEACKDHEISRGAWHFDAEACRMAAKFFKKLAKNLEKQS